MDDLYRRALDPEWQRVHKQMGFSSPLADLYEALGFYDEEDQNMNISAIHPDGPTIAIEHQATGEQPVNVTPEGIQPADQPETTTKRMTNADRIRSMTDEELAIWLDTVNSSTCSFAMNKSPCDAKKCPCWLDWLKQEADE